jgi:hypothetical protein
MELVDFKVKDTPPCNTAGQFVAGLPS